MDRPRIFLAIGLSSRTRKRLGEVGQRLIEAVGDAPVKPVAEVNMHLTLKFIGEVGAAQLGGVLDAAQAAARSRGAPRFEVRGLGTFPPRGAPRVIWAGIHEKTRTKDAQVESIERCALAETARLLDEALVERLGSAVVQRERRPFAAHVTLGRVRSKPRFDRRSGNRESVRHEPSRAAAWLAHLEAFVREHENTVFGEEAVRGISVMKSRLGPGGPEYEELDRFEFEQ